MGARNILMYRRCLQLARWKGGVGIPVVGAGFPSSLHSCPHVGAFVFVVIFPIFFPCIASPPSQWRENQKIICHFITKVMRTNLYLKQTSALWHMSLGAIMLCNPFCRHHGRPIICKYLRWIYWKQIFKPELEPIHFPTVIVQRIPFYEYRTLYWGERVMITAPSVAEVW